MSPPWAPPNTGPATYTINATGEQDQALRWVAGENGDPAAWLQDRNNEILDSYVRNHNLAHTPVPTIDVASAYAYADAETQQQVVQALGLGTPTPMPMTPVISDADVPLPTPPPAQP
jgi:hypothetical protein